jgi:NAD(P)-dependent dehydrogenase (short-subunit alcohol dehydrogenase family)
LLLQSYSERSQSFSAAAEFADTEAHQALPRPLTPEDTAAVVAMLAREDAAALTGQTLTADGGLVMR